MKTAVINIFSKLANFQMYLTLTDYTIILLLCMFSLVVYQARQIIQTMIKTIEKGAH